MGANQSSSTDGARARAGANPDGTDADTFYDYYELLQVEQTATGDEIRKSYRKLALKHHPDKNPDNIEQANKIFHKLQEAYEILSDDQERAWYDQNRERLLNGEGPDFDDEETFDAFRSGNAAPPPATSSARGITARTLLRFFDPSLSKDLSDDDDGFFGTYRRLFERLAQEEMAAAPYPGEESLFPFPSADAFPPFGYSHTPFSHKDVGLHQSPVKDFYAFWLNFQSRKSFGWMDQHDLRDAPERRVKRWMEKENKKGRDAARREYNEAVRSLAAFVRKRDPRYKAWQEWQNENGPNSTAGIARRQAEADRIRKEREDRARSFQAQNWQMAGQTAYTDSEFSDSNAGEAESSDSEEDDELGGRDTVGRGSDVAAADEEGDSPDIAPDAWDCVACDKLFRSEAAFRNHERSAKHRKAVNALRRQMQEEEEELGLGLSGDLDTDGTTPLVEDVRAMGLQDYAEDVELDATGSATAGAQAASSPRTKKQKAAARKQHAAAEARLAENDYEGVSAGFSLPSLVGANGSGSGKSKKQQKKDKKRRDLQTAAAAMGMDDDGYYVQDLNAKESTSRAARRRGQTDLASESETSASQAWGFSAGTAVELTTGRGPIAERATTRGDPDRLWGDLVDPVIPSEAFLDTCPGPLGPGQRPPGSFDVFGYGSLIFKPPPYLIGATPGFIKGFARRFAQSSIDHRGTPEQPGRVATLISADDWHRFEDADDAPEGDIVWGVSYTIDPDHADTVRAYLDYREKNGYTAQSVKVWGVRERGHEARGSVKEAGDSNASASTDSPQLNGPTREADEEVVIVEEALVYVGLPSNPAFVGPQPLPALAQRIHSCQGPSGRNDEYLLNLAEAIRNLAPQSVDAHLFELERLVLGLKAGIAQSSGDVGAQGFKVEVVGDGPSIGAAGKKARRAKKEKALSGGPARQVCNVCASSFKSRSKLFEHIRETGHALAPPRT